MMSVDNARLEQLANWLCSELGATSASLKEVSRLTGGAIQENWAATLILKGGPRAGRLEIVLRCPAPSGLAFSHAPAQEFAILQHAYAGGVRVPEPLAYCGDPDIFGRPVLIMRRVTGTAAGHLLVKTYSDTASGDSLVFNMGAALAMLHRCDPWPGLPCPDPVERRLNQFRRFLDDCKTPQPVVEMALHWIAAHAPQRRLDVPCHYDFRNGNIMVEDGTVSAVLDWEFANNGDPYEDLGWFCAACWRFGRPDRPAGGLGSRAAFFSGYESVADITVDWDAVSYWEIVALTRWCVVALAQAERFTSGAEPTLELGLTGLLQPGLQRMLLTHLEEAVW